MDKIEIKDDRNIIVKTNGNQAEYPAKDENGKNIYVYVDDKNKVFEGEPTLDMITQNLIRPVHSTGEVIDTVPATDIKRITEITKGWNYPPTLVCDKCNTLAVLKEDVILCGCKVC